MKRRTRMGLPKAGAICSRRMRGAAIPSVPENAAEMLRDIMEEQQLAAKQRRLIEFAANQSQHEPTTPEKAVALLNRIAKTEARFTPEEQDMARKLGF